MLAGMGQMRVPGSKDLLVKVLAVVFLNPMDRDHAGKKIFIQGFLGCGCPDEVVEQARIRFFVSPLGALLERRIAEQGACPESTPLERDINGLLRLPKHLRWPRNRNDMLISPGAWRRPALERVASKPSQMEKLIALRKMSHATIDAVIEVPGRAFFFLVVQSAKKLEKKALLVQYESGQVLYKLMRYNRCRLFTITEKDEPKIIAQVDTALCWQGLQRAFFEVRDRYAFADRVLDLFDPVH